MCDPPNVLEYCGDGKTENEKYSRQRMGEWKVLVLLRRNLEYES